MLRAEKGDNTTPRVKTLKIENVIGSKEVDYFIQQRTADGRWQRHRYRAAITHKNLMNDQTMINHWRNA